MASIIREMEAAYDLVLLDAPPLLPVTDAAVLASLCSGALMITRHGHTKRDQLVRAVEALHQVDATVYGVVLTMTPAKGPEAHYYGYGYRYDAHTTASRGRAELVTPQPAAAKPRPASAPAAGPVADRTDDPLAFFQH